MKEDFVYAICRNLTVLAVYVSEQIAKEAIEKLIKMDKQFKTVNVYSLEKINIIY